MTPAPAETATIPTNFRGRVLLSRYKSWSGRGMPHVGERGDCAVQHGKPIPEICMTSQSDETNRFRNAAEQARRNFEQARHHFDDKRHSPAVEKVAGAFGGFRRACKKYLPGGERTMWVALGLIVLVLFVWAILPGQNAGNQAAAAWAARSPWASPRRRRQYRHHAECAGHGDAAGDRHRRPQVSGSCCASLFRKARW